MKFSICIICKNESKTLPALASSLKNFLESGGEVVVLDTGSSDDTLSVSENLGFKCFKSEKNYEIKTSKHQSRIINTKFKDPKDKKIIAPVGSKCFNFSGARNECASYASNDMILAVDASDRFENFNFQDIEKLIEQGSGNSFFYNLKIKASNGVTMLQANRFYDRRIQQFDGVCHESLYTINENSYKQYKPYDLNRHTLEIVHERQTKSRTSYMTGIAIDVANHNKNARMLYLLGREYYFSGLYDSAIKILKQHITTQNSLQTQRAQSSVFIGQIYENIGDDIREKYQSQITLGKKNINPNAGASEVGKNYRLASKYYLKAFDIHSSFRTPLIRLAELALKMSDFEKALVWVKGASQIKRNFTESENSTYYTFKVDEILFRIYYQLWKNSVNEGGGEVEIAKNFLKGKKHWLKCREVSGDSEIVKQFSDIFSISTFSACDKNKDKFTQ